MTRKLYLILAIAVVLVAGSTLCVFAEEDVITNENVGAEQPVTEVIETEVQNVNDSVVTEDPVDAIIRQAQANSNFADGPFALTVSDMDANISKILDSFPDCNTVEWSEDENGLICAVSIYFVDVSSIEEDIDEVDDEIDDVDDEPYIDDAEIMDKDINLEAVDNVTDTEPEKVPTGRFCGKCCRWSEAYKADYITINVTPNVWVWGNY